MKYEGHFSLFTSHFSLFTSHFSLFTSHFSPLTSHFLPPPVPNTSPFSHHLLRQQLRELGLDEETPPDEGAWLAILARIGRTYHEADQVREQWRQAYDQLREEQEAMVGSVESLRRSSADLITAERDKLQAVIHALGEGLCSLNHNGCVLFMNAEAEKLLGWPELEVRGRLILDWVMPSSETETTTETMLNHIRRGQKIANYDAHFLRADGRSFPASYTLDPIFREGEFTGAVLVFRDITARKQVEEARERQLRETLLLNRVIATATSTLDVHTILQTICTELAAFFNLPQTAFALLDKSEAYLRVVAEYLEEGRIPALGTIIPLQNNPATQEVLQTHKPLIIPDAQTDPRQPALHEIARLRGTRSVLILPLLVRGQVLGTLGLNAREQYDFTPADVELAQNVASAASQALSNAELYTAVQQELAERQRTEEALAQARDKALEASKLKSELIAKVSHELRTPLASILGFAEMLQLGIYGPVNPEQEETLGKMLHSTETLVTMVNDLLDLAQLEAGTFKVVQLPFEPATLLGRVESTMRIIAEGKGLTLTSHIHPALPSHLLGDGDRLHQILLNLVSNAVKFTDTGGVAISLHPVGESQWAIAVQDSGPGVPHEMQHIIFDEFRQVDYSLTRRHKGVGLGLAIVKQIVTAMHGDVRVESTLGEGSTFVVTLPMQPA